MQPEFKLTYFADIMPRQKTKRWNKWTKVRLKPDVVRNWRLTQQLSQRGASIRCDMSEATWRRCEAGDPVQALTAARLAEKSGINLLELRK